MSPSSYQKGSELLTIVGSSEEAAGKTLAQSARDAVGRERNGKLRRAAAYAAARVVVDLRVTSFALARDYEAAVRAEAEARMDSDMAAFTVAHVASHTVHIRQLRAARKQATKAGRHSLQGPSAALSVQQSSEPSAELSVDLSAEHSAELSVEPSVGPSVEPSAELTVEPSVEHSAVSAEQSAEHSVEHSAELSVEPSAELSVELSAELTIVDDDASSISPAFIKVN